MKRLLAVFVIALAFPGHPLRAAGPAPEQTQANVPVELTFTAQNLHADPFNEITLDLLVTDPGGKIRRIPAFWAGGAAWKARYASPLKGAHAWKTECSDHADAGLEGVTGTISISDYSGANPLYQHGPIRIAEDARHFSYGDGSPFFWLGDTWWMGLCHRLHFPDEFAELTADRQAKGFNVIQIVAGLYPDMPPFDPRGANETGFPWEPNYARIRPDYFDAADARLRHLIDHGFTPCIVGAWGYFLPWMGVDKVKAHWRYLIARYGALPVVWCAAGEANLPYYQAKGFPYDDREQVHGWTEILRYIRATDPFRRPLTIHPTAINQYTARHATDDPALLDFDMLQTPHGEGDAARVTVSAMHASMSAQPVMPVLDGEAAYEMLGDHLPTEWTRAMFWICLTNGAAGHTYGANGIWQCNRREQPHGASPTGGSYGRISWDEAMRLPGSNQEGLGKKFLESLPWRELQPLPDAALWTSSSAALRLGDWIWFPEGDPKRDAPVAARFFRRSFDLSADQAALPADLCITADDRFAVSLNGRKIGSGEDWSKPRRFDVREALRPGRNVLAVRAENAPTTAPQNPAGLAALLAVHGPAGPPLEIATGPGWRAANQEIPGWEAAEFDDSTWAQAVVEGQQGVAPWGVISHEAGAPPIPPQVCGLGDRLRLIYAQAPRPFTLHGLPAGRAFQATLFDPVTGERTPGSPVVVGPDGACECAAPATGHDWVLLLEAR